MIALGRQIHRLGILANGNPAKAHVKGDIEVLGTWFTCVYTVMEEATWEAARARPLPRAINPAALFAPPRQYIHIPGRSAYDDE